MSKDNSLSMPWLVLLFIAAVVALSSLGAAINKNNASYVPSNSGVDRSTFEHRYVTERFKQEGFNKQDSQKAADAVIKFLNAQEARK